MGGERYSPARMGELTIAGAWTALITPFRDGAVDTGALDVLIDRQIDGGTDVIVSCGTTGESPTLSHAEHDAVIAQTIARAAGRVPVVAGTGSNATSEAVRLTKAAAHAGAAGSLQVNPYYNRPGQEGLYRHFATVAESVPDLPIVLYNVPGRSACRLEAPTLARLAAVANIVGIKEADGSVARVSDFLDAVPGIAILSGDDALTVPMMSVGATGIISVAANLIPERIAACVRHAAAGEYAAAQTMHKAMWPLFRALFVESNPIPVKAAHALLGHCTDEVRLPLTPATAPTRELLAGILKTLAVSA